MQIPVIIHHHAMLGLRSFSNSFVYMANKKIWTRGEDCGGSEHTGVKSINK
jgi:hypothetical protein